MNEMLIFVETLKGCGAASENKELGGCRKELQLLHSINSCFLLLTPFSLQTAVDGAAEDNDKIC